MSAPPIPSAIPMKRLQTADKLLGLVACTLLQPLRWARWLRRRRAPAREVLLIKFWGLGSLQLLTPAVAVLRQRHPGAHLTLLTLVENAAFARGLGVFDAVETLDVRSARWAPIFRRIASLALRLRRRRFQAVYDFEFFTRFSAVVAFLIARGSTHGFAAPSVWRGGLHTDTAPFNRYWHVARNFRCLAGGENGRDVAADDLVAFRTDAEDERALDRALAAAELGSEGPLVLLNPNAGALSLERRWPPSHFAELARRLMDDLGARVVLLGAPGELAWTGQVAALLGPVRRERFANLAGELELGALHALLRRADLFVTNDSGPMHLGAAVGVPTIGLFGPETPVMYAPLGPGARALYRPPACSPCINVHDNKVANCLHGKPECLLNLGVDLVHAECRSLLARRRLRVSEATGELRPAPRLAPPTPGAPPPRLPGGAAPAGGAR